MPETVPQMPMPVEIDTLDERLKQVFSRIATEVAFESGLIRRQRILTGQGYARGLVFGWLAQPDASYSQLQEMLALQGCEMTAQAVEQRLGQEQSVTFFERLLSASLSHCLCAQPVETSVFEQFEGVYLQDGTLISLPKELKERYKGFGGRTQESGLSAMRIQVRLNLANGAMQGPWLQEAVECEREGAGSLQQQPLPANALYVVDSHYPTLKVMQEMSQAGQWFLTHMKADMQVFEQGVQYSLPQFLHKYDAQSIIDQQIEIGASKQTRQKVRLLAFRVSEPRAQQRREQVNQNTKKRRKGSRGEVQVGKKREKGSQEAKATHRHRPGKKRIELAAWTILLTNVPGERLTPQQARTIMRARWQIELLWKLWKQQGLLDLWRSEKPARILSEIFAKLLGLMVQHWVILVGCWQAPDRSMVKASRVVRLLAISYALALDGPISSVQVLDVSKRAMRRCRLDQSRQHPSTACLLEHPELSCRLT